MQFRGEAALACIHCQRPTSTWTITTLVGDFSSTPFFSPICLYPTTGSTKEKEMPTPLASNLVAKKRALHLEEVFLLYVSPRYILELVIMAALLCNLQQQLTPLQDTSGAEASMLASRATFYSLDPHRKAATITITTRCDESIFHFANVFEILWGGWLAV